MARSHFASMLASMMMLRVDKLSEWRFTKNRTVSVYLVMMSLSSLSLGVNVCGEALSLLDSVVSDGLPLG